MPMAGSATATAFESWQSCAHVLALQKILGIMLPESAQTTTFAPVQVAEPATA